MQTSFIPRKLTLAKKFDAVHSTTVARSRSIPSVCRATPANDGFTSKGTLKAPGCDDDEEEEEEE